MSRVTGFLNSSKMTGFLNSLATGRLEEPPVDPLVAGLEAHARGDFAAAEPALLQALKTQPKHLKALVALARIRLATARFAEAEAPARAAEAINPADPGIALLLGEILQQQKRLAFAEASYRKAIKLAPSLTDAHIRLGALLFELRRLPEAQKTFEQAIGLDRSAAVARFYLAQIALAAEDFQRALGQLYFIEKIQPDFKPAILMLADIYERMGDTRQSVAEYYRLVDLELADADVYFRLGLAQLKLRAKDLALLAFQGCIAREPRHWEANFHVATLLEEQRNYEAASKIFRFLLESQTYGGLARLALGRIDKVLKEMANQMQGNPDVA